MQNEILKEQILKDEIIFECTPNNYGSQILAFNNDEIDVILRNQNKNARTHNVAKEIVKYKITIEKVQI